MSLVKDPCLARGIASVQIVVAILHIDIGVGGGIYGKSVVLIQRILAPLEHLNLPILNLMSTKTC